MLRCLRSRNPFFAALAGGDKAADASFCDACSPGAGGGKCAWLSTLLSLSFFCAKDFPAGKALVKRSEFLIERSPKEACRPVDADCSHSSTEGFKENSVSKLATRTSDAWWSRLFGRMVSKTKRSADSVRCPVPGPPTTRQPTDSAANPIASAAIPAQTERTPI
jgi:hypothetical protein